MSLTNGTKVTFSVSSFAVTSFSLKSFIIIIIFLGGYASRIEKMKVFTLVRKIKFCF
jgi:hypothetical protein